MASLDWASICQRLVTLATSAAAALQQNDLARFRTLAAERGALYDTLLAVLRTDHPPDAVLPALFAVRDADWALEAVVTHELHETRAALSSLHRGRRAVHGYAAAARSPLQSSRFVDRAL